MPRTATLHGAAPDESTHALLIVDLISDFRFPDGSKMARAAGRIVNPVAALAQRARRARVPVIYVNDNRGRWRSDRTELIERARSADSLGKHIIGKLAPHPIDYFIFKPKHSGFFATPLAALLEHLGSHTLVMTGLTAEQCILFTAIDAYVRDFELIVPRDCVAGLRLVEPSIAHLEKILKAKVTAARHVTFPRGRKRR